VIFWLRRPRDPILSPTARLQIAIAIHFLGTFEVSQQLVMTMMFFSDPLGSVCSTLGIFPPFHLSKSVELLDYSIKYVVLYGYHKRVPRLFVIVKEVNTTDIDETTILLQDPTGEMQGTIHKSVNEKWGSEIKIGSVLHLESVSVFNPTPFAHYLNVTGETVIDILPPDCKSPPMDETVTNRLAAMNPACIYKRRRDLENEDLHNLHHLAQQQVNHENIISPLFSSFHSLSSNFSFFCC